MAKLPNLEHVKYVRSKGKVYAYFNTGQKKDGKPIYARLPNPSASDFYDKYAAAVGVRTKRMKAGYTVASLADDYARSLEFASRADSTQKIYTINLTRLKDRLGKFAVDAIEPRHVRAILDNEGWGAATKNMFVSVIGAVYAWARPRGKAKAEPTKDIERLKTGEHDPWPEDIVEAALVSEEPRVRLAVHLLYFTGQRIGDVCAMRWSDIRNGKINITQQKGDKRVSFHVHSELQAELDQTPRRGITILTSHIGRQVSDTTIRDELQAFTLALGHKTVPHGLRKNAVNVLLEAGCTIAEVASITGQSFGIVEHYAAKVNTNRLSDAAMLKFENSRRRTQGE